MCVCMNRIRNNSGEIIGYTIATNFGLQFIEKEDLRKNMVEHKIYVNNLKIDDFGRLVLFDRGINKYYGYIFDMITNNHWFPGGIMHGHNLKNELHEFYTKFDMIISEGDRFAKKIETNKNIPYTKTIYSDTMDCSWNFYNGVFMYFDKFEGKIILQNNQNKNELSNTPYEVLETKYFTY